jgi:predicted nucleic acid-binding protein
VTRYCLDTSAYSQFKRGAPEVVALLDSADWVGVPSVTLGELWVGFLLGGRLERSVAELREFLDHPVVHEIVVDREVARIYAEIVRALRKAGTPLPTNDVWIAAAAAHTGTTVLTYDEHFGSIERVASLILPGPAG